MSRLTTLVAMVGAGVLVAPTAALADSWACSIDVFSSCAGQANFISDGEHFYLRDQKSDGHSAVLQYWRGDTMKWYTAWNHNGAGTTRHLDLDMPEGTDVSYYVCLGEYEDRYILTETCGVSQTWDVA